LYHSNTLTMKIKIKLSPDELRFLEKKTNTIFSISTYDLQKDKKSAYTIMLDIADKVMNKAKNLNRQLSIGKKKHDVSLKWHEAETLELFLTGFQEIETDPYDANLFRKIISQINQKLA
jgi:hypothetical protein